MASPPYQIHETRADCAPKGPDTAMSEACREGANYAINVSKLIPQDYTLITSLSEASNAFAKSVRVSTLLADAEVTTRARMPVVIENYIGAFATGSQPPSQVRDRFLQTLSELENVAEDASVAFCIFAAALGQSEASSSKRYRRSKARWRKNSSQPATWFKAAPEREHGRFRLRQPARPDRTQPLRRQRNAVTQSRSALVIQPRLSPLPSLRRSLQRRSTLQVLR
jgi:hypothetical protein